MALWGVTDGSEAKPKNLTTDEKKEVYATESGWTREAGSVWSGNGNTNADPELLVAVSGLAVSLGSADLTEIEWISTAFDVSAGGLLQLRVRFNEAVDVTGTPQLTITNDTPSRNVTASYSSGSGSNELIFAKTIGAAAADTADGDVLSVGTNALALNSGTIKDKGTNTASTITNVASIGTAAGTITVVA